MTNNGEPIVATLIRPGGRFPMLAALVVAASVLASCGGHSKRSSSAVATHTTTAARSSSTASAQTTTTTSTTAATTGTTTAAAIHWRHCKRGQCGTLRVPLSYRAPHGKQITLALYRLPAKDAANKIGTILLNPGGPGASGVQFAKLYGLGFPASVRARFDVVGWDPRGVGASDPIECGGALGRDLEADQAPVTAAQRATLQSANRRLGQACQAKVGAILGNVSTVDTARDMDRIRAALGEQRITYVGYSYGTYLGAVYANMFPTHLRAMVLDGVSDPGQSSVRFLLAQARSLDRATNQFLATCAKQQSCAFHQAGHSASAFTALASRLQHHPLRVGARRVGPTQFYFGVSNQLYGSDQDELAKALAAAVNGNGAPLLKSYDDYIGRKPNGAYTSELAANTAINCDDARGIRGIGAARNLEHRFVTAAPLFGRFTLYNNAVCGSWPVTPQPPRLPITAAGAPPIVVIGNTLDPVTPYSDAVSLAHELRSGVLLTTSLKGHTSQFLIGGPCDALGTRYLLTTKPPKNGTRCIQHTTK
jgi:pimeloyl-ACP methyl ester carboxylesterase